MSFRKRKWIDTITALAMKINDVITELDKEPQYSWMLISAGEMKIKIVKSQGIYFSLSDSADEFKNSVTHTIKSMPEFGEVEIVERHFADKRKKKK